MSVETIAGLAIGLLGIAASVVTYLWTRERKHLDYELIVNTPLMGPEARTFQQDLELRFRGTKVDDPHLVIIRLINTGNRPVAPDDQISHISLDFSGSGVDLVTADVLKTNIPNPVIHTTIDRDTLCLAPFLFNQGDWIAFRMLVDGKSLPIVRGRVLGIREFRPYRPSEGIEGWEPIIGICSMLLWVLLAVWVFPRGGQTSFIVILLGFVGSFVLGSGLSSLASRRQRRRRDAMRITFD